MTDPERSGRRRRAPTFRERGALLLGRAAGAATRRLGRGGGTALPGLVAATLAPSLVEALGGQLGQGAVTVTGTNGKTTTTRLLAAAASRAGLNPFTNASGSNLERGIVSSYVEQANGGGALDETAQRLGVIEVDEAAMPAVFTALRPQVAVFLNLFRDQLDRYGEVDSVAEGWRRALSTAGEGTTLVLNGDDPSIALLAEAGGARSVTFGVEDRSVALDGIEHAADARFCLCGEAFEYEDVYMGHVGIWSCDSCGRARSEPDVAARDVDLSEYGVRFQLDVRSAGPGRSLQVDLPFVGLYSVYNALAAAAAAHALGLPMEAVIGALEQAGPAFGRQERFVVDGRNVRLLLAKNPTGLNEVARTVASQARPPSLLAILNDGVADGRDVSWIYDADIELLAGHEGPVIVSGSRADDLALRFALAGVEPTEVVPDIEAALERALALTAEGDWLEVVPTYTAMLTVRAILAARTGAAAYWETAEPMEVDA
jgi:UDP-N-acetylmuramyl tripeptide synthase